MTRAPEDFEKIDAGLWDLRERQQRRREELPTSLEDKSMKHKEPEAKR